MRPTLGIDAYVIRWARREFKRMPYQTKEARDWFVRCAARTPSSLTSTTAAAF